MLTFSEAMLFGRAGDDVRFTDWPAGDFVRWDVDPKPIPGYGVVAYVPTPKELNESKWRRA
jgi:hypothetical protein